MKFLNQFSPKYKDITDPNDIVFTEFELTLPLDDYNVRLSLLGDVNNHKSKLSCYDRAHRALE
jgi:hypothetical protein